MDIITDGKSWHRVEVSKTYFVNCLEWCQDQFGSKQKKYIAYQGNGWFYEGAGVFRFLREEDAVLFRLKFQ